MVKTILSRSSWQFAGLAVGKLLSIGLFILFARVLLPELFGQFVLFITIIQLVTALANMGLKPWFQTQAAQKDPNLVFGQALQARLLTLLISFLFVLGYLLLVQPFSLAVSIVLLLILIPEALSSLAESYWLQQQQPARVGIKTPLFFIIVAVFWMLSNMTTSLATLSVIWLIASIGTVIWFFPWKSIRWSSLRLQENTVLPTLRQALPYAFITTAGLIYSRADQLIIQWFRGFSALGVYSAAYRLIDSINLLPQAIAENLFPEAAKKGSVTLRHVLKIELVLALVGIFIACSLYLVTPWMVPTLLGTEYLSAIPLINIFCVLLWFFFVNAPLASVVQSSPLVKRFLPFGIANTVLNVVLNLLLVPSFGLATAAWVMVFSEVVGLGINVYFVRRLYRV